ncbi:MAG: transcriptional repressor [Prevotellaceae bacterium]|jgi:Fe2+ or Zn2+ uptake regulation protein|nr:transcriptional repressor [Prevotellaceae bacterium]
MDKQKRNTKTKQLVMNVLSDSDSALCYEDFDRRLSGKMDRATVYRILQGFCDEGKVHKITVENGRTYYALCLHCQAKNHNDKHLHFRCVRCETILCIDEPFVIPALPAGYRMTDIQCLISGHCPNCLTETGL